MKRSIGAWELLGFGVTSLGGTLLHFLYDWLGSAVLVAPFSGVNESTWEHMKLLFWPMFIFAIIQSLFFKEIKGFWCVKMRSILLGLMLIPMLFYFYNGVVGKSPDWLNIAIFFISAAIAYVYEYKQFIKFKETTKSSLPCIVVLVCISLLFIVFTFFTPEIGIFKDPITGLYGI